MNLDENVIKIFHYNENYFRFDSKYELKLFVGIVFKLKLMKHTVNCYYA